MANRIYISVLGTDINFSSICTEDIAVQAQSQFTRIGDFIPSISSLASTIMSGQTILGGKVSEAMENVMNALDVPIWQKTEPVKITTDLNFFVKTSGYYDVWRPTMILQSMGILSKNAGDGTLITPGMNIGTIAKFGSGTGKDMLSSELGANSISKTLLNAVHADFDEAFATKGNVPSATSFSTTSKLCSVYIPAIVYLPLAIVEVAQPTWSKQLTDQGYPIWAKVNVQFTGLYPAVYEDNFESVCPETLGTLG